MNRSVIRVSISANQKRDALVAARKVRNALEEAGAKELRGEYVRQDKRIYVDAPKGPNLPDLDMLSSIAGEKVRVAIEDIEVAADISSDDECLNCGNVPDVPSAVCPNCGFREIGPCPHCGKDIARNEYLAAGGDSLFQCPSCQTRVRLAYNEPRWRDDRRYNEPAIVVTLALQQKSA